MQMWKEPLVLDPSLWSRLLDRRRCREYFTDHTHCQIEYVLLLCLVLGECILNASLQCTMYRKAFLSVNELAVDKSSFSKRFLSSLGSVEVVRIFCLSLKRLDPYLNVSSLFKNSSK